MNARDAASALHETLRGRAVEKGLCAADAAGDDARRAIEALIDQEVRVPSPADEECRRWYEAHPREFTAGELVFARHILFAVTPRTPVEALRRKAEETLLELRTHPELFGDRARELSNCPSAAQDGALGQLTRGECVPEFEAALFGEVGTGVLPTLVRTRHGFHVVRVDRRVPGQRVPYEAVKERIAARLGAEALGRALSQYAQALQAS